MARPSATRIKNFKKEDLALQFILAMGKDTITSFSNKTGIATSTISRYINQRYDCPPNLSTIRAVADHSADRCVTFESLALDAGYTKKDIDRLTKLENKMGGATKMEKTVAKKEQNESVKEKMITAASKAIAMDLVGLPPMPAKPVDYERLQKKVEHVQAYSDKTSMSLLSIVNLVGSYDVRCQPEFYIFDDPEKFKKFSKLVILHGVKKAVEYADRESAPVFMFPKDVLLEYVSDRPIRGFYALNSNRFGVVL